MLRWAASLDPDPEKVLATCARMHARAEWESPKKLPMDRISRQRLGVLCYPDRAHGGWWHAGSYRRHGIPGKRNWSLNQNIMRSERKLAIPTSADFSANSGIAI